MTQIATWSREVQAIVIALIIVSITLGIAMLLEGQFDTMLRNQTGSGIPSAFRISSYQAQLGLIVTLLVIAVLVLIVFNLVIPTIQKGAGATTATPAT